MLPILLVRTSTCPTTKYRTRSRYRTVIVRTVTVKVVNHSAVCGMALEVNLVATSDSTLRVLICVPRQPKRYLRRTLRCCTISLLLFMMSCMSWLLTSQEPYAVVTRSHVTRELDHFTHLTRQQYEAALTGANRVKQRTRERSCELASDWCTLSCTPLPIQPSTEVFGFNATAARAAGELASQSMPHLPFARELGFAGALVAEKALDLIVGFSRAACFSHDRGCAALALHFPQCVLTPTTKMRSSKLVDAMRGSQVCNGSVTCVTLISSNHLMR